MAARVDYGDSLHNCSHLVATPARTIAPDRLSRRKQRGSKRQDTVAIARRPLGEQNNGVASLQPGQHLISGLQRLATPLPVNKHRALQSGQRCNEWPARDLLLGNERPLLVDFQMT